MAVDMGSAVAYLLLDATNFNTSLQGAQGGLVSAGKVMTSVGATMTATVTKGLINLGKTAVTESANFESAMAQVRATMLKSTDEFNSEIGTVTLGAGETLRTFTGSLTDFALEMAATTKFTATETAEALNYMALAGYDTQQSMEMLPSVLSLAAAGAMDLALASDMVTDTQTAFGLSSQRTAQLVDEMAKAASTGNTSVQQLGEAFLVVGGLAKELNGGFVTLQDGSVKAVDGVQELEIALTAMANAGIKGSEAGTHMRNMLLKLSSPTSEGAVRLEALGVSAFDAQGKMRSLSDIFGDLNVSMSKLTQQEKLQAISDLFNVRDTAAAEAILSAIGEDWNEIGEAILNAEGAAQDMADIQLDNLNGQVTILKSSLQVLAIRFGNLLLPAIKKVVEWIQKLSEWLNSLNDTQKMTVMRIALIVAAIGPVLLIVGRLVSLIGAASQGFAVLGSAGVGSAGLIAGALIGVIAVFARLYKTSENFRKAVTKSFATIKKSVERFILSFRISVERLKAPLDNLVKRFEEPFTKVISTISKSFSRLIDNLSISMIGFADNLAHFIDHINFDKLLNAFGNLGTLVLDLSSIVLPGVISVFGSLLTAAEPAINGVIDLFGSLVSAIGKVAKPIAEGVLKGLQEFAQSEGVKNFFKSVGDAIGSIVDGLTTLGKEMEPIITELVKTVSEGLGKLDFSGLFESLGSVIESVGKIAGQLLIVVSGQLPHFLSAFKEVFNAVVAVVQPVIDVIADIAGAIAALLNGDLQTVKEKFSDAFSSAGKAVELAIDLIKLVFSKLWSAIQPLVQPIIDWFTTAVPTAIDAAVGFFEALPGRVATFLTNVVKNVIKWAMDLYKAMSDAIKNAVDSVVEWLSSLPGKFSEWFGEVITTLKGIDLAEAGKSILNSLWNGLKSVWDSIVTWFNNLTSLNFASKILGGNAGGSSSGSGFSGSGGGHHFSTGLDYVPRTMNVTVHRGERILTQEENEAYNKGGSIEVTTYQNDAAINNLSSTMDKLLDEVKKLNDKQISLDGKKLVGGLINEVDRQLGIRAERARGLA